MLMPSILGENLFDDFMDFPFDKDFFGTRNPLYGKNAKNLMKTDVRELEDHYELDIDLPGFKKDEVTADLKDGYLIISAAKGLDKDEQDKKGRMIRQERYAGSCTRSFYVGNGLTVEDIHGKFENGILQLSIPKKTTQKIETPSRIAIEG